MWDRLLTNCNVATMDPAVPGAFGAIEDGAIGIQDGRIVRVGRRIDLAGYRAKKVEPLGGAWVTPGLIDEMLPAIAEAGLAKAVDGFCEGIGFTPEEIRRLFEAADAHGLRVKLHAEQLSNLGGAALAAEFGALSADHLEHADDKGIEAMARAGTVAVLLPGAFYALRVTRRPPVDLLRSHGVPMAVATDCNPGTSPILSPTLMMSMACTLFGLPPEEALAGMTIYAARALGLEDQICSIAPRKAADVAAWRPERLADLG